MKNKKTFLFLQIGIMVICFIFSPKVIISQNTIINNQPAQHQEPESSRFNHLISGYVTFMPDNVPFEGVIMTFSGIGDSLVKANGYYSMWVPRHWTGTVTPHLCDGDGYTFDPPQRTYTDVLFDQTNQNYSGVANAIYTVSGKFTDKYTGAPLANKQITFQVTNDLIEDDFTVTTNALGEYSFQRMPCWANTLDPKLNGTYYFEPITRTYNEINADMPEQDYAVINYNYPIPPGWETINTGNFAIISVEYTSNPNICGTPLNIGDLIGVFYTDNNGVLKCGGYGRWQNESNVAVTAQGDDNITPEKDGFALGEAFKWRIYSYAQQETFPAWVELKLGLNTWVSFGLTLIKKVDANYDNGILLPQGWSGLSSYTKPVSQFITQVMSPIANKLVLIQDMTNMYYPSAGINTLGVWTYNKGYKIKVTEDVYLPMNGCPQANKTINLTTTWNMIPVLSECEVATADIFAPIIDNIVIVKEVAGTKVFWPEMGIETLQVLEPGKSYYTAVSQNTSITYGDCEALKSNVTETEPEVINITPWNTPSKTAATHTIAIRTGAITDFANGDFIGAFTDDGTCAGLAQINDITQNLSITIFGDDVSTDQTDGFAENENVNFKIFRTQTDEEINAIVEYDGNMPLANGRFMDNGLSAILNIKYSSAGISTLNRSVNFFPNPSTGWVEFVSTGNEAYHISIQNMNGQLIMEQTLTGNVESDLSTFSKGVYVVKIEGREFRSIEKLILK